MVISHILYKVENKEEALKYFEDLGFTVMRGGFNHNIWFEDGSFIEIVALKKNRLVTTLLKIFGKKSVANRFKYFQEADYGFMEYSLHTEAPDLEKENNLLKEMGYKYNSFEMKKKIKRGLKIRWKITFPFDLNIPFFCGDIKEYETHRRPDNIVHKNGAKRLEKLVWGVPKKYIDDINRLNDDDRLELVEGSGFKEIKIEGLDIDVFDKKYYK